MGTLQEHINNLKSLRYLWDDVDTILMTCSLFGALNELALNCSQNDAILVNGKIYDTISQLVVAFVEKILIKSE